MAAISRASLPAMKSTVSQLAHENHKRLSSCVASWYTLPHFIVKSIELILSVIVLVLLFVWESEGVKITSLNQEDYNYRNKVFYYVGVACITIMYSVVMTILGCSGVKIPSKARTFFAGVCLLMWMLANPIMSSTLDVLKDSVYARRNGLNFVYLDVALVMGFFALAIFAIDILLGFTALRKSANKSHLEKTETDQLKNSRSVITAARITARHSNRKVSLSH